MDKNELLKQVTENARQGRISLDELKSAYKSGRKQSGQKDDDQPDYSASDVLFYIGGALIFAAIVVILTQTWDQMSGLTRSFVSLGSGAVLWYLALRVLRGQTSSDTTKGLGGALLLAGSLTFSTGAFISVFEIIESGASISQPIASLLTLVALTAIHLALDKIHRHVILIVFAVLLGLATYYNLMYIFFNDYIAESYLWSYVSIIGGLILILVARLFSKSTSGERRYLQKPFRSLGGFVILASTYSLTTSGGLQVIWQILFPLILYGAFLLSIRMKVKSFLYSGGFFLFIYIMTIGFNYFGDGLGVAFVLLLSAVAVIGSAMLVVNIRKKYFP